ncbi:MAG: energy-coupling factor transporter ATPase [Clostridiales bacterium]|nr:energy-coupling factor transporter ATPase [Clostridiales bacterium]
MEPILELRNLSCVYSQGTPFEHRALSDVSLSIYPGEYVGMIGHTGSGKSTLIQHLNGLLKPTSGQILLHGKDIWESKESVREAKFHVGLVFQYPEYQLFEETVYKDIAFGPTNMKLSRDEIDRRVHEAAHFVGLEERHLEKSPFELSGGQKRRVAIAGVIAMEPEVLILDEPTAGLDPAGRDAILANIRDYHQSKGSTIILVSHSMEEVARSVERIVVVNDGKIPLDGTPHDIFSHSEELRAMGLGIPQVTQVFQRLKELGLPIEDDCVYTMDEARDVLLALAEKRGRSAC